MKLEIRLQDQIKFTKIPPDTVIRKFLEISKEQLTKEVKRETPVGIGGGKLRNSWTPRVSGHRLTLTNSRNYAVFVEKGTGIFGPRRHRIFPKSAKVLHFKSGGVDVFTTNVRGQPARHMAEKGLENFTYRIPNVFHNAVRQTIAK